MAIQVQKAETLRRENEVSCPQDPTVDLAVPLWRVFDEAARDAPDQTFLQSEVFRDETYTFGRFADEARAVGRALVAAGVAPGDRVVLFAENRPRWCVAYAAVLCAGAVVVPLDAHAGQDGLQKVIEDCGARALCVGTNTGEAARLAADQMPVFCLDDTVPRVEAAAAWGAVTSGAEDAALPDLEGGDRPAAILYSSGTTGTPKGVVLTHANLRAELNGILAAAIVSSREVFLMFLPLHHLLAQIGSFMGAAVLRTRVIHVDAKKGEDLLCTMREHGVTLFLTVPLVLHLMHERILGQINSRAFPLRALAKALLVLNGMFRSIGVNIGRVLFGQAHRVFGARLRLIMSGGSALDAAVHRDFHRLGFTVLQAYGLTESSGAATVTPIHDVVFGSVGIPLAGVSIRIANPDTEGVGEVLIRGDIVTPGYLERPEATAEALRDGWLHTGDLGRLDARCNLVITGRAKDVIVLGSGKNVHPEEVEAHYVRAPHVKELCVIARRRATGSDRTEKLHAVVVPDWERLRTDGITSVRNAIHFELESRSLKLAAYQRILTFELRKEPLPRTPTQKVRRFQVAEQAVGPDGGARELPEDPPDVAARLLSVVGQEVVRAVTKTTGDDREVRGSESLELDLGLDSLNRMELLLEAERIAGVRISAEQAESIVTLDDLLRLLEGAEAAEGRTLGSVWSNVVEEAGPSDLPRWLAEPRGPIDTFLWTGLTAAMAGAGQLLFGLKVRGLENLPPRGPYLICPNHQSFLDGPSLHACLPRALREQVFSVGEAAYLKGRLRGGMSRLFRVVPTDADRALRSSMRIAAAALKHGGILIIFPEGVRSPDGTLKELKQGFAILARELSLPIIPVWINGAFEAWPRSRRWPRLGRIRVAFGAPLDVSEIVSEDSPPESAYREITAATTRALKQLCAASAVAGGAGNERTCP